MDHPLVSPGMAHCKSIGGPTVVTACISLEYPFNLLPAISELLRSSQLCVGLQKCTLSSLGSHNTAVIAGNSTMEDCCAVCAEPLEWTAYGQCGHTDACSK